MMASVTDAKKITVFGGLSRKGICPQLEAKLNHTGCGFTTFTDAELNAKFSKLTGDATPAPMRFFAFKDPEQQTKDQIEMVRSHPWISKEVSVRGFIFDVNTGRLQEVMALAEAAS